MFYLTSLSQISCLQSRKKQHTSDRVIFKIYWDHMYFNIVCLYKDKVTFFFLKNEILYRIIFWTLTTFILNS